MSKNVAMISTINKRKVMLHKDFAKTFSLSNKKSYPIKIANQRMNSSQKQIKKINTTSSKDIKLPKTSRITLSKGNPLLNSGKKIIVLWTEISCINMHMMMRFTKKEEI